MRRGDRLGERDGLRLVWSWDEQARMDWRALEVRRGKYDGCVQHHDIGCCAARQNPMSRVEQYGVSDGVGGRMERDACGVDE